MSILLSILLFVAILVVLIVVHEFGHFIVAKRSGIRVDEFGIFFGPKLFGKKIGETEYTLNLFPIGGFVKIFGEDPDDEAINGPDKERSFVHKSKWTQAAVLVAGVGFNILIAWFIFIGIFATGMPVALSGDEGGTVSDVRLTLVEVLPDSPAEVAGLLAGDQIIRVSNSTSEMTNLTPEVVTTFVSENGAEPVSLTYIRKGEKESVEIVPEKNVLPNDDGQLAIGVSMILSGVQTFPFHLAVWEGFMYTVELLGAITVGITSFLFSALTLSADLSEVAGPVGIVSLVGESAAFGVVSLLMFTALISLNLAVVNLLPVPALDGGRLLFVIIEAIKGSPIKPTLANMLNTIGFVLLILLMIVVTFNDVLRLTG